MLDLFLSSKLVVMKMLLTLCAIPCLILFNTTIHAQDEKPLTLEQEKSAFQAADAALNKAYQTAKSTLSEWEFSELQEDQREWIEFRDSSSQSSAVYDDGPQFEEREESSTAFWRTMKFLTQTRARIIKGWTEGTDRENFWDGEWTDGYGGWLRILQDEDTGTFRFFIEVVRGPTYHLGMLSGQAKTNGSMAFFSDEGTDEKTGDDPETWLIFDAAESGPRLTIRGVNTSYYHGVRAYFGGTYTWVGELDEAARKEVLTGKREGL